MEAVFSRMILSGKTNLWVGEEAGQIASDRAKCSPSGAAPSSAKGNVSWTFSLENIAEAVELRRLLESHVEFRRSRNPNATKGSARLGKGRLGVL